MFLTATTSREVSQMLVSASSEWELGRESWAVSLALRVRTWTECPEDNLRELMWDSNPNPGMPERQEKKKKKKKKPLLQMEQRIERYQRSISPLPYRTLPPQWQRGRCSTARATRQWAAAISSPETTSATKLSAGSQLLTMSSWDPGWFTSARSVTAWDQLPRGDTWHTWETKQFGPGRFIKCKLHLG